jgi:hypothetical protein
VPPAAEQPNLLSFSLRWADSLVLSREPVIQSVALNITVTPLGGLEARSSTVNQCD